MLYSRKPSWLTEDAEDGLNVFVPGLMVTGILVSMVMLVADQVRRLFPARGQRARAVRIEMKSRGRISDLAAVGLGVTPETPRIDRVPRDRFGALGLAAIALCAAGLMAVATIGAYTTPGGTLYHRGWTLSFGFGVALIPAVLGAYWLLSAVLGRTQPEWMLRAARRWPFGGLPDLTYRWKEGT
jgi:hypothetical protein